MSDKNTKTYKEQSRSNWYDPSREKATHEQIQTGCLQRIADATEVMANNYNKLLYEIQSLKAQREHLLQEIEYHKRSASAYKGKYNSTKKK